MSMYKDEDCFMFLPFSLERKRKKQGEPTNGSPLTPFQRSTGTLSPSIAPAQWEGLTFLVKQERKKYRADEKQEKAKNGEAIRGRELAGNRNIGRQRE